MAAPLLTEFDVTVAVKFPSEVGRVDKLTVSDDAVAVVTLPIAPLLKTTELFVAVRSNPNPLMVMEFAFASWLVVLLVTTGMTVAI